MTHFWNKLLTKIYIVNKRLQKKDTTIDKVVKKTLDSEETSFSTDAIQDANGIANNIDIHAKFRETTRSKKGRGF